MRRYIRRRISACFSTRSVQNKTVCFTGDGRRHLIFVNLGPLILSFVARISFRVSSYRRRGFLWLFFCFSKKTCWLIFFSRSLSKAVPLQAWSDPEGCRKLRFPDYVTTAQDGGKVVSLTHRPPLPPGNIPGTHFC